MLVKKINENIMLLALGGSESNIYLVNNELLIDSGTGFHQKELVHALTSAGAVIEDIKRIVLTHGHFDHIGGIHLFRNAKIGAHKDDATAIESVDSNESMAHMFAAKREPKKLDFCLDDGDTIKSGDMKLKVIHAPGHTKGSICLYDEKNKILFSGDTVFADGFGRLDLPGGSSREMKQTLARLAALDVNMILPGHGGVVWASGSEVIRRLINDV